MYKIIQNNKVVDILKVPCFVSFLRSGHIAITDKTSAQGVVGSDGITIYSFKTDVHKDAQFAIIEEITLEEFSRLQSLLNSGQEPSADAEALTNAKLTTIKRLSALCKNKITSGFSVKLSDGKEYGFKLTTEDQLNLMAIENRLNAGEKTFIYHFVVARCNDDFGYACFC